MSSLRLSLARLGRWPRLLAAAACLLLALASAVTTVAAHRAAGHQVRGRRVVVAVAAHTLPAGHRLRAADLRLVSWPTGLAPPGCATNRSTFTGRRLAGPLAAGEAVTRTRLVGSDLTRGLPAGRDAVPVPLADAHAADLIGPGERVDVIAAGSTDVDLPTTPRHPARVASHLLVLAVLRGAADTVTELVLAADPATALRLSSQAVTYSFTAVLVDP